MPASTTLRSIADRLLENPLVYRGIQAPFAEAKLAPFFRRMAGHDLKRVLDVGCGPGTNARHFTHADYTGIDINADYIASASRRFPGRFVVGDVTDPAVLPNSQFECVIANSLLHHLDDASVRALLGRLARLVAPGGSVHVLDLVMPPRWNPAKLLATLDRGRHARPLAQWRELFAESFVERAFEPYPLGIPLIPLWQMVYFNGTPRP